MRAFTLILMAATVFGVAAHAQLLPTPVRTNDVIHVKPGFSHILRFDRPVVTIQVANTVVADAYVPAASNRRALVVGKIGGETSLVAFDENGNDFYEAIIMVERDVRPPLDRVFVHSRPILQRFWAYKCVDTSCWRVDDRFEGPPPEQRQSRIESIYQPPPGEAPSATPAEQR
jgi:hypothetical protein